MLCNDNHGDTTRTKFEPDFRFIGFITENNTINTAKRDDHFVQNAHKEVDITRVKQRMKGPTYSVSAENYIFQKTK